MASVTHALIGFVPGVRVRINLTKAIWGTTYSWANYATGTIVEKADAAITGCVWVRIDDYVIQPDNILSSKDRTWNVRVNVLELVDE